MGTFQPRSPPICETDFASSDPVASASHGHASSSLRHDFKGKQKAIETPSFESASHSASSSSTASTSLEQKIGNKPDKTSWNYVLKSGLAGGIAGSVAKTAIAPLDRVKILFQAQNPEFQKYSGRWLGVFTAAGDIIKSQGPMGLLQGHSATLMRIFPYAAIKYMAYDKIHFYLMPTKQAETSSRLFIAGSVSGCLSVFLTYPLELIRVRLAFETKRKSRKGGLRHIIYRIYTEGSTDAPFSSDVRKRAARAMAATSSTSSSAPAAAAASHIAATLSTSTSSVEGALRAFDPNVPTSAVPSGSQLLNQYPLLKFYRGFSATLIGMIPYAGTSFLVFGRCKTLLHSLFPPSEPSAEVPGSKRKWYWPSKLVVDLSAGALAGALSQTAAYPFEVVRRRQQVGGIIRPGGMLSMAETIAWIYKTSGWRGFYVGLSIGFLKVVPMTSISFAVWLEMKRQLGI